MHEKDEIIWWSYIYIHQVDSFYGQVIQRKEVGRFGLRPSLGEKRKVWTSAIHNSLGKSNPFGKKHHAACLYKKKGTRIHMIIYYIYIYVYYYLFFLLVIIHSVIMTIIIVIAMFWCFWGFEMFWELRMASDARRDPQLWLCDLSRSGIPCKSSQSDKLAYIIWI